MNNSISDILNIQSDHTEKNSLIGRLLTPQEIDVVAGGTGCGIQNGGSTHTQGGGTYTQGPSGSYGQGGSGGGTYNQTC